MGKTYFTIAAKQQNDYLLYLESSAQHNTPIVYRNENTIVFEVWVDGFDYEFSVKDGRAIITAKERNNEPA